MRAALDRRPSEGVASTSSLTYPSAYQDDRSCKPGLARYVRYRASVASATRGGVAWNDAAMRLRQTVGVGPGALRANIVHSLQAVTDD
jgi:hypothetical protein